MKRRKNKIEFIEQECARNGVRLKPPKSVDDFLMKINIMRRMKKKSNNLFFEEIEKDVSLKEKFVFEQTRKEKDIFESYMLLREYKQVLILSKEMLIAGEKYYPQMNPTVNYSIHSEDNEEEKERSEHLLDNLNGIKVSSLVGTIELSEKERFKKLIFRATRGNALAYFRDFQNPLYDYYGNKLLKTVYVVMFPDGETIREKLSKL